MGKEMAIVGPKLYGIPGDPDFRVRITEGLLYLKFRLRLVSETKHTSEQAGPHENQLFYTFLNVGQRTHTGDTTNLHTAPRI